MVAVVVVVVSVVDAFAIVVEEADDEEEEAAILNYLSVFLRVCESGGRAVSCVSRYRPFYNVYPRRLANTVSERKKSPG